MTKEVGQLAVQNKLRGLPSPAAGASGGIGSTNDWMLAFLEGSNAWSTTVDTPPQRYDSSNQIMQHEWKRKRRTS